MRKTRITPLAMAILIAILAGCDQSIAAPEMMDSVVAERGAATALDAHGDLIKAVRGATARYNSTVQAVRAGYVADDHCVFDEDEGGMGFHWVNGPLIDPVFDPLEPEVLLYEPGSGNEPRLIGVEYIVIDVGQPHPHFGDHPFDVGGVPPLEAAGVPHYSLHVWVHKDNPSGMFEKYNPTVSCH